MAGIDKQFFTLTDDGQEKKFSVVKFDALTASEWVIKLLSLASSSAKGLDLQSMTADNLLEMLSHIDSPKAGELRDKLRSCVCVVSPSGDEFKLDNRAVLTQHIKEFQNIFLIEAESAKANFGFFIKEGGLNSLVNRLGKTLTLR